MSTDIAIVSFARSPLGRSRRGGLATVRPDDLGASVLQSLLNRVEGLDPASLDDFIVGCAMPEGDQGLNMARTVGFLGGLPDEVPAMTLNRFCSSGLEAIAEGAAKIGMGWQQAVVAGGIESMSAVPMGGYHVSPNPTLMAERPAALTAMGQTAEIVAERFDVSREAQDQFALQSHQRAARAQDEGRFDSEIVPFTRTDGVVIDKDEGIRRDTSLEGLAKLRAVFRDGGSVTAGNSSQTTDGAAFVVLMSGDRAKELGLEPIAWLRDYQVAGVDPEIMGIGPLAAIPKLLEHAGMKSGEIDLFEINEAFAAQAVYVVRELGLDPEKVNPNGGAIALGHPLGCTGARLTATLLAELKRTGGKHGIVSMCIGGGMGAAGLFEMA